MRVGNEECAAADTEHPGEHAGKKSEKDCERIVHFRNSQTAESRP